MISLIHPILAFEDNYIWVFTDQSGKFACVVDPGDAAPVEDYLEIHGLILKEIIITHHHQDHVGGLPKLIAHYSPRVSGPSGSKTIGINNPVSEGESITVFETDFSVIEVPGHTLDHIAYFSSNSSSPILFCGDTLFAAGCGRLFEGSPAMMVNSLAKLAALPPETAVYCTHEYTLANLRFALAAEPQNIQIKDRVDDEQSKRDKNLPTLPSTIDIELSTNPFLRCDRPELQNNIAKQMNVSVGNTLDTFANLRRWKDNF